MSDTQNLSISEFRHHVPHFSFGASAKPWMATAAKRKAFLEGRVFDQLTPSDIPCPTGVDYHGESHVHYLSKVGSNHSESPLTAHSEDSWYVCTSTAHCPATYRGVFRERQIHDIACAFGPMRSHTLAFQKRLIAEADNVRWDPDGTFHPERSVDVFAIAAPLVEIAAATSDRSFKFDVEALRRDSDMRWESKTRARTHGVEACGATSPASETALDPTPAHGPTRHGKSSAVPQIAVSEAWDAAHLASNSSDALVERLWKEFSADLNLTPLLNELHGNPPPAVWGCTPSSQLVYPDCPTFVHSAPATPHPVAYDIPTFVTDFALDDGSLDGVCADGHGFMPSGQDEDNALFPVPTGLPGNSVNLDFAPYGINSPRIQSNGDVQYPTFDWPALSMSTDVNTVIGDSLGHHEGMLDMDLLSPMQFGLAPLRSSEELPYAQPPIIQRPRSAIEYRTTSTRTTPFHGPEASRSAGDISAWPPGTTNPSLHFRSLLLPNEGPGRVSKPTNPRRYAAHPKPRSGDPNSRSWALWVADQYGLWDQTSKEP